MKKRFALTLLSLMPALCALTGCGDKGGNNVITIGVSNSTSEKQIALSLINAFNSAYPDYQAKLVTLSGSDYSLAIMNGKLAGTLPDLLFIQDDTSAYFAEKGVFQPLDDFINDKDNGIDVSLYYDSIMQIARPLEDNKTYFMPRDYNKVTCFYNKDIFDEANVSYPNDDWTWEEYLETCEAIKQFQVNKYGENKGYYPTYADVGWKAFYWPVLASYGEKIIDNGSFAINKDSKGLALLKSMVANGYVPDPNSGDGASLFTSGYSAMLFSVRPNVSTYVSRTNLDFVTLPKIMDNGTPYTGMGCSGYGINADSKNKDNAWKFLRYIVSREGQAAFGQSGNGVPMIKDMANDDCWKNVSLNLNKKDYDLSKMNHDAFIKFPERDLITNYMGNVPAKNHKSVYTEVDDFIKAIFTNTYLNDLESCISVYGERINKAINAK